MNSERKKIEELNSLFIKENPFLTLSSTSRYEEFDEDGKMLESLSHMKEKLMHIKTLEKDKRQLNCDFGKIEEFKVNSNDERWPP